MAGGVALNCVANGRIYNETNRDPKMLQRINEIKSREGFRPIAPIVKCNAFDRFFVGKKDPYMLFCCNALPETTKSIPSVVHVDGTSRVQVVSRKSNYFIYTLVDEFEKISGIPVIINTSFNLRGKPIIEQPLDAVMALFTSNLDFLVLEDYLVEK